MVNPSDFDHLGPFWAHLDPFIVSGWSNNHQICTAFPHSLTLTKCIKGTPASGVGAGGHSGRTLAPEAIEFESPCRAHSEP